MNDNLKALVEIGKNLPSRQEFVGAFQKVVEYVKGMDARLTAALATIHSTLMAKSDQIHAEHRQAITDIKGQVNHVFVSDRLSQIEQDLHGKVDAKLATVENGKPGKTYTKSEVISMLKPYIPSPIQGDDGDAPTDEKLIALITPLIPKIDDIAKKVSQPQAPARASNATQFFDLSTHTNGALKVFSVPENLAGVLFSSDFPMVLMENNGFTLNATRTQLTMTTAAAPSSGSQLLFQFISIGNYYG